MKIRVNREGESIESDSVMIIIGETKYRFKETNQGRLEINKTNFDKGEMLIYPSVSNQIEIE